MSSPVSPLTRCFLTPRPASLLKVPPSRLASPADQVSRSDAKIAASDQLGQDIVDTFTTLSAVTAYVDPQLHPQITYLIPIILFAIRNRFAVIRHAAAKSVAIISDVATVQGMKSVVELVLPYLGDPSVAKRQGAVEVVAREPTVISVSSPNTT